MALTVIISTSSCFPPHRLRSSSRRWKVSCPPTIFLEPSFATPNPARSHPLSAPPPVTERSPYWIGCKLKYKSGRITLSMLATAAHLHVMLHVNGRDGF